MSYKNLKYNILIPALNLKNLEKANHKNFLSF